METTTHVSNIENNGIASKHHNEAEKNGTALDLFGRIITWDQVRHALCSALEGGSNYWYGIDALNAPTVGDVPWHGESKSYPHLDYPLREGGSLVIVDLEDGRPTNPINRETIQAGLRTMAAKYIKQFARMIEGEGDAWTADTLLQCIAFGEVIYG